MSWEFLKGRRNPENTGLPARPPTRPVSSFDQLIAGTSDQTGPPNQTESSRRSGPTSRIFSTATDGTTTTVNRLPDGHIITVHASTSDVEPPREPNPPVTLPQEEPVNVTGSVSNETSDRDHQSREEEPTVTDPNVGILHRWEELVRGERTRKLIVDGGFELGLHGGILLESPPPIENPDVPYTGVKRITSFLIGQQIDPAHVVSELDERARTLQETRTDQSPGSVTYRFGLDEEKNYFLETNFGHTSTSPIHTFPEKSQGSNISLDQADRTDRFTGKLRVDLKKEAPALPEHLQSFQGISDMLSAATSVLPGAKTEKNWAEWLVTHGGTEPFSISVVARPLSKKEREDSGGLAQLFANKAKQGAEKDKLVKEDFTAIAKKLAEVDKPLWTTEVEVSAQSPERVSALQDMLTSAMDSKSIKVTAIPEGALQLPPSHVPLDAIVSSGQLAELMRYPTTQVKGFDYDRPLTTNTVLPTFSDGTRMIRLGTAVNAALGINRGPDLGELPISTEQLLGVTVLGRPREGKSVFTQQLAERAVREGMQVIVLAPSGAEDWRLLGDRIRDTGKEVIYWNVVAGDADVSVGFGSLARPIDGYSEDKHYAALPDLLASTFEGDDGDKALFRSVLNGAIIGMKPGKLAEGVSLDKTFKGLKDKYKDTGLYPSNDEIYDYCKKFVKEGLKYDGEGGEYQSRILGWLERNLGEIFGADGFNSNHTVDPNTLTDDNLVINTNALSAAAQQLFVAVTTNYVAEKAYLEKDPLSAAPRPLTNLVIAEEGQQATSTNNSTSPSPVASILEEHVLQGGKFGYTVWYIGQEPRHAPRSMLSSARFRGTFSLGDETDISVMGDSLGIPEQSRNVLRHLPNGTMIGRVDKGDPFCIRVDDPANLPSRVDLVVSPEGRLYDLGPSGIAYTKKEYSEALKYLGGEDWWSRKLIGILNAAFDSKVNGVRFLGFKEVPGGGNSGDPYKFYNHKINDPETRRIIQTALEVGIDKIVEARSEEIWRLQKSSQDIKDSLYAAVWYHLSDPTGGRRIPNATEPTTYTEEISIPGRTPVVLEKTIDPWFDSKSMPQSSMYDTPKELVRQEVEAIASAPLERLVIGALDGLEAQTQEYGITLPNSTADEQRDKLIQEYESTDKESSKRKVLEALIMQIDTHIHEQRELVIKEAVRERFTDSDKWEKILGHPIPGLTAVEQQAFLEMWDLIVHKLSYRDPNMPVGNQIESLASITDETSGLGIQHDINVILASTTPEGASRLSRQLFDLPGIGTVVNDRDLFYPKVVMSRGAIFIPVERAVGIPIMHDMESVANRLAAKVLAPGVITPEHYYDTELNKEIIDATLATNTYTIPFLEGLREYLVKYFEDPTDPGSKMALTMLYGMYEEAITKYVTQEVNAQVREIVTSSIEEKRRAGTTTAVPDSTRSGRERLRDILLELAGDLDVDP